MSLAVASLKALASLLGLRKKGVEGRSQSAQADRGGAVDQTQVHGDQTIVHGPVYQADPEVTERVFEHQRALAEHGYQIAALREQVGQLSSYLADIPQLPDTDPVRQLTEAAGRLMGEYHWGEAEAQLQEALRLPTTPAQRAALHNLLGQACYGPSDLGGAEAAWRDSLREAEQVQEEQARDLATAAALGNIGVVLQTKGDLDGALDHHRRSLAIHERIGHLLGQADTLGNIGLVLQTRGALDGALEHHRKSLDIHERIGRLEGQANQLGNIGLVLRTRGDLDGALEHHRKSLAIHECIGRLKGQASQLGNIGIVLGTRGDLDGALEHFRKSLAIDERIGHLEGQAIDLGNIGLVLRDKGDLEGALEHLQRALQLFETMGAGSSPEAQTARQILDRLERTRQRAALSERVRGRREGLRQRWRERGAQVDTEELVREVREEGR